MKVELKCKWCGKYFEGIYNVPQKYCEMKCAKEDEFWQQKDQRNRLNGGGFVQEKSVVKNTKTQPFESSAKPTTSPIEKKESYMQENPIEKTVNYSTKNEPKGPEKTVNTQTENNAKITQKIESSDSKELVKTESKETLPEVLSELFLSTQAEKYHMTSLLDSSANALHSQMQGMFANYPDQKDNIRTYEPEKVQTSVMCAREIVNILRLKLDIVKVYKGVK